MIIGLEYLAYNILTQKTQVNDYTTLKERVKTLNAEVELYKKKSAEFEAADESQKEDIGKRIRNIIMIEDTHKEI